jgi:hypothetical protein
MSQAASDLVHARQDLLAREAQIARPKGDLVGHERAYDLIARVLPHVAHATGQLARCSESRDDPIDRDGAVRREKGTIQHASERRLSGPVEPEQHRALARHQVQ